MVISLLLLHLSLVVWERTLRKQGQDCFAFAILKVDSSAEGRLVGRHYHVRGWTSCRVIEQLILLVLASYIWIGQALSMSTLLLNLICLLLHDGRWCWVYHWSWQPLWLLTRTTRIVVIIIEFAWATLRINYSSEVLIWLLWAMIWRVSWCNYRCHFFGPWAKLWSSSNFGACLARWQFRILFPFSGFRCWNVCIFLILNRSCRFELWRGTGSLRLEVCGLSCKCFISRRCGYPWQHLIALHLLFITLLLL